MKTVIAINGSPRKTWNMATLLEHALKGATSGPETELIHLYDLDLCPRITDYRKGDIVPHQLPLRGCMQRVYVLVKEEIVHLVDDQAKVMSVIRSQWISKVIDSYLHLRGDNKITAGRGLPALPEKPPGSTSPPIASTPMSTKGLMGVFPIRRVIQLCDNSTCCCSAYVYQSSPQRAAPSGAGA